MGNVVFWLVPSLILLHLWDTNGLAKNVFLVNVFLVLIVVRFGLLTGFPLLCVAYCAY